MKERRIELAEHAEEVREALAEAARRAGRAPGDITLVAVSKFHPASDVRALAEAGQADFGENYVQEAQAKREELADLGLNWHFIGGLQSNKARFVAGNFCLVHSVDSRKLAQTLHKKASELGVVQDILIQVNIACEEQKSGITEENMIPLAEEIMGMGGVRLVGLMTLPPFFDDPARARPVFARLRELRDALEGRLGHRLPHLSMGMTGDFVPAVEEGATLVRIGTRIFGARPRDYKRKGRGQGMDLGTVIGIVLSFGLVISAILTGSSLIIFVSVPSFFIVIGGTLGAAMVNYPLSYVIGLVGVIKNTFFSSLESPREIIDRFKDYANRARREGILFLEPLIKEIDDDYMRKGLQLTVDGLEPQTIQEILETEVSYLSERHATGADVVAVLGTLAPAMGMIGTVIGLVQMLQTMSDPSTIGPAMAVALLTTLYGAILANLVFNPMAGKLKARSKEEILLREMIMEGILSISKGENPRIIEEKLNSYLPPKDRVVTD